ncbi:hypothetical protein J7E62_31045 [Variovorax paradoxus]|nr:hypothetical protein [Variovorax paradoxus]
MKIAAIAVLATVCIFSGPANSLTTFGAYDCGEWFQRPQARGWLLGVLTGVNLMTADDKIRYDPLNKLGSAEQAYLWMDNYCRANPLKTVLNGASDLYLELQKK